MGKPSATSNVVIIPTETGKNIQVGHPQIYPEPWLQSAFFGGRPRRLIAESCQCMPEIKPATMMPTATVIIAVDPLARHVCDVPCHHPHPAASSGPGNPKLSSCFVP